ncbi:HAMP domain-containing protein [Streptomyces sp. NPDC058685]|uniref:HAMP domain-containing protein n=1 Tax=Streptomyces sp. NPDC058685 TaxID=3346598 RepID=UPI00365DAC62
MALDPDSADRPLTDADPTGSADSTGPAEPTKPAPFSPAPSDPDCVRSRDLRPLLIALQSLRDGDFTARVDAAEEGILTEIAGLCNQIAVRNEHLVGELQRVRREVVRHGRLDERLSASPGQGSWVTGVDSANTLLEALVAPVSNATRVLDAVADGELTQRIDLHDGSRQLRGDLRRLALCVNRTVDQLSLFTGEVTRVAREVGTEGRLGGRAHVRGLSGDWRLVIEAVNTMASRLTSQVRDIAVVTTAVARGDLTQHVTVEATGEVLELKLTVNTMVDQLRAFADEVTRVAREVGTEGQLGGQAHVRDVSGVWKDLTDNVNFMASNLTSQVRNIAQVTTAVADGDLSKKITVDARGEILELKDTVNTMVDQLRAFADEVTRVAREVGTEGQLGGRAQVGGVSGVWKDLTDNVNFMADNLTSQVRNIAQVATAVAQGDLSKKIDVDARGEILELKTTINTMVDTLSSFSAEVTRVAREVGSEGQLGGQARVEGVYGTWKRLTTSVNELALNLTTQVRAIAEVASSVAQGDLTGSIAVEASGEVNELKNNVNLMVSTLRETTRAKDWLESNLTRIAGLMQGHRDLVEVADLILRELTPLVNAQFGAFFMAETGAGPGRDLQFIAGYGCAEGPDPHHDTSKPVRGLITQAALEKKRILVDAVPAGYISIESGLGSAPPTSIVILPILFEGKVLGVIELASFSRFNEVHLAFIDQFVNTIGVSINTILSNARTEALLSESQRLTTELRRSNAALEDKAALLASSSQYKSEFLANMSHELRTPLNSLLILARLLADNPDGNLAEQEVDFAATIHRSGSDLLQLINDILDLSKIEAGRMDVHPRKLPLTKLLNYMHAMFRPLASERGLSFDVTVGEGVPSELYSDEQRLQQILRNLLSNAVKFTSSGSVVLRVERATHQEIERKGLPTSEPILAFCVEDTGIGIPREKLGVIFEAFQQTDGTTSRKYGGTGLGLSISREVASMLGGRIVADSEPGVGSRFTLYVPAHHTEASAPVTETPSMPAIPAAEATPAPVPLLPAGPLAAPTAPRPASGPELPADVAAAATGRDPSSWPETTRLKEWITGRPREVLAGRTILMVDDDIRAVFALMHVLGRVGITVKYAENGREGLEMLDRVPAISLVLMDIMMPEMDGYETIAAVRDSPRFADLPIIALTAKAMPGDREKALEAGASEYIPKPVDVDHLLSVACDLLDPQGRLAGPRPVQAPGVADDDTSRQRP